MPPPRMTAVLRPEPVNDIINYGTVTARMEKRLRKRFRELVAINDETAMDRPEVPADALSSAAADDGSGTGTSGRRGSVGSVGSASGRRLSVDNGRDDSADKDVTIGSVTSVADGVGAPSAATTAGDADSTGGARLRLSHALMCVEAAGKVAGEVELFLVLRSMQLTTSDFASEDVFVDVVRGVLALRYRLLSLVLSEAQFMQVIVMLSVKGRGIR